MKIKTNELIDPALDWAVAKCEENSEFRLELRNKGYPNLKPFMRDISRSSAGGGWWPSYSTDWSQGGPIIEREEISIKHTIPAMKDSVWQAHPSMSAKGAGGKPSSGPTALVAAMRCYVASKLGDEVEIPEELLK